MELTSYNDCKPDSSLVSSRNLSMMERLQLQKSEVEARLERINVAITALKANPETLHVLECISKV